MCMNIDGKELAMEGCGSNVTETGDLGTLPQSVCTTPLFGAKAILAGAAVFGRVCQTIHDSNAQNKDECLGRFNCSSGMGLQIGLDIQVFGFGTCLVAGCGEAMACKPRMSKHSTDKELTTSDAATTKANWESSPESPATSVDTDTGTSPSSKAEVSMLNSKLVLVSIVGSITWFFYQCSCYWELF